jgi:pyruvate dehydrogenase E1 component alpha subunit
MHLHAPEVGLIGTVPIVGGTISLAVGAALAAKKSGGGDVSVAFFGDGAAEEGVLHESLNLAAVWNLPAIFVCENNLFSSHLHIALRQPSDRISRFALAHRIESVTVDGNDVVAVRRAASLLIESARKGRGPGFIEAVTYRWRGHVGYREDDDVGVNRGPDLPLWKERDPVKRLTEALIAAGIVTESQLGALRRQLEDELAATWERARKSAKPEPGALMDHVYAGHGRKT